MTSPQELKSLSFFSGCLGLDLGLEQSGINQVLACDFNKHCRATIKANRPNLPVLEDITKYSTEEIRETAGLKIGERPTLIVGGPPCQAFSTAGKRQSFEDPRGNVFLRYIELIGELQPDFAVIENVRGLLSAPLLHTPHEDRKSNDYAPTENELKGSALNYVIEWLERLGYSVSFNLYNSANYGVPQVRERVILIAARDGSKVPFLIPTHSNDPKYGLKPWTTFRDASTGLIEKDSIALKFPESRLHYYRMLKPGQYWKHLPTEELKKEAMGKSYFSGGGKTGFFRRLAWDKPSPTIVTSPTMPATDLAHPEEDRPLSIQEYKRIQQFPDDWILTGSLIEQYKQVGNAVPVGLGRAVGKAIIDHLSSQVPQKDPTFDDFPYSRYKNTNDSSWRLDFKKSTSMPKSQQLNLSITSD